MESENNQENTQAVKRGAEFITSDLIDSLLNKLKSSYFLDFFEDNQRQLTRWGLYGLYVSALLGLLISFLLPMLNDGMDWGMSLGFGFGFVVYCLVSHYLAVKFLPNVDSILKGTPSTMGSRAFLDSLAFLFLVSGILSLAGGIFFGISDKSLGAFLSGLFGFILCEYLVALCLKPELLNISVEKETSAAQELLGLLSFFIKAALKLVPIAFGSSVVIGILYLLSMLFGDRITGADVMATLSVYSGALLPLIGFLIFLSYYFMIDIILAILSLHKLNK